MRNTSRHASITAGLAGLGALFALIGSAGTDGTIAAATSGATLGPSRISCPRPRVTVVIAVQGHSPTGQSFASPSDNEIYRDSRRRPCWRWFRPKSEPSYPDRCDYDSRHNFKAFNDTNAINPRSADINAINACRNWLPPHARPGAKTIVFESWHPGFGQGGFALLGSHKPDSDFLELYRSSNPTATEELTPHRFWRQHRTQYAPTLNIGAAKDTNTVLHECLGSAGSIALYAGSGNGGQYVAAAIRTRKKVIADMNLCSRSRLAVQSRN